MPKSPLSETVVEYLQTECGHLEASPISPGLYRATIISAGTLPETDISCSSKILQVALPQFLNLKAFLHPRHNPPDDIALAALLGCFQDVRFADNCIIASLRVCGTPLGQRLTHYLNRVRSHTRAKSVQSFANVTLDITVAATVEQIADNDHRCVKRILAVKQALIA